MAESQGSPDPEDSESLGLFLELGYNPLDPEEHYAELDGQAYTMSVETARSHAQSMKPRLNHADLRPGDEVVVTYEDGQRSYRIQESQPDSHSFDHSTIANRPVIAEETLADLPDHKRTVELRGTSISMSGSMLFYTQIMTSHFMNLYDPDFGMEEVVPSRVASFEHRRPDAEGQLRPVRMNASEPNVGSSESFSQADKLYSDAVARLENTRPNEWGWRHLRSDSGFISRPSNQHLYVYDADHGMLRGISSIPEQGVMQLGAIELTPEELAAGGEDWRSMDYIASDYMYRGRRNHPMITHTWLHPDVVEPIVSIGADGRLVGPEMASGVQHQTSIPFVRIDPRLHYSELEIDLVPMPDTTDVVVHDGGYWVRDMDGMRRFIQSSSEVHVHENAFVYRLGRLQVEGSIDASRELEDFSEAVRRVAK